MGLRWHYSNGIFFYKPGEDELFDPPWWPLIYKVNKIAVAHIFFSTIKNPSIVHMDWYTQMGIHYNTGGTEMPQLWDETNLGISKLFYCVLFSCLGSIEMAVTWSTIKNPSIVHMDWYTQMGIHYNTGGTEMPQLWDETNLGISKLFYCVLFSCLGSIGMAVTWYNWGLSFH